MALIKREGTQRDSKRRQGVEFRAMKWAVQHPKTMALPATAATAVIGLGPGTAGTCAAWLAGGVTAVGVGWWRGAPA
ncbi:hypothetical protein ACFQ1S_04300, partial [Kibdelosporangium lantanae]